MRYRRWLMLTHIITHTHFIPAWDVRMYFAKMTPMSIGAWTVFARIPIMDTVKPNMQRRQPTTQLVHVIDTKFHVRTTASDIFLPTFRFGRNICHLLPGEPLFQGELSQINSSVHRVFPVADSEKVW